jgi:glyoxylase-like metal-dependent hydrolase (beta-lactamase superfamily II)
MLKFRNCLCSSVLSGLFVFSSVIKADAREFYTMNIGDISVTAILDTTFEMNGGLIKNGNADTIKKYLPDGKLAAPVNVYIVKTKKQTILVDAGTGARLIPNMTTAGFSPDSINLVLITHAHYDHVGGLVKDGKPLFPNATIMLSANEKTLYEDKAVESLAADVKPYFMPGNQMCKVYGSKVQTFNYGAKVADGIVSVDLHGHTAGQSGYMIESKGQKLLIAGDFLHIAPVQLVHPEYSLAFDADINQAVKTRKMVLEKVAKEKILVAGMHIQFPGIGKITKGNEGYVFTPVK